MTKILQIFFVLFSVGYGLTFAILALLQFTLVQYSLALQDIAWMCACVLFGGLLHRLSGYLESKEKGKRYYD